MEGGFSNDDYNRDSVPEYVYTISDNSNNISTVEETEPPNYSTIKRDFFGKETKMPFDVVSFDRPQVVQLNSENRPVISLNPEEMEYNKTL